ncbi:Glucosamine kinase GspK (plasmid) [Asticcacaulis sp. MM231]
MTVMKSKFSPAFYIGVDGGGTKCRARLRNEIGDILGEAESGPANIRLGLELAWSNIMASIDKALAKAGLTRDIFPQTAVGLGLAGVVTPNDCTRTLEAAPKAGFGALRAAADYHVACLGAFEGRDGGIQIAGTGSSGYAIISGKGHPVGGWGFVLSEKGSAAALGRDAVAAALKAHDGLASDSPFTRALIAHFGHPAAIIDWSERARPSDYGALSPIVFDHARQRDAIAIGLIEQTAADIDTFIAHQIKLGAPRVCLVGGLGPHIRPWLSDATKAVLAEPATDILDGAILLARQSDDATIALREDA